MSNYNHYSHLKFMGFNKYGDRVYRDETGSIVTVDEFGNETRVLCTLKIEANFDLSRGERVFSTFTEGFK